MSNESNNDTSDQFHTVTTQFDEILFRKMQEWLQNNNISVNELLERAVVSFISQPQTLEPVDVLPE